MNIDLPSLQSLIIGNYSFNNINSLSLISNKITLKIDIDLPVLKSMSIGESCFVEKIKDFQICNLPNLENINIKKTSLRFIKSFSICNNQLLKTINIEDGTRLYNNGQLENYYSLFNVKTLIIESNINDIYIYCR